MPHISFQKENPITIHLISLTLFGPIALAIGRSVDGCGAVRGNLYQPSGINTGRIDQVLFLFYISCSVMIEPGTDIVRYRRKRQTSALRLIVSFAALAPLTFSIASSAALPIDRCRPMAAGGRTKLADLSHQHVMCICDTNEVGDK